MAEVDFVLRGQNLVQNYGILSRDFKPIITFFFILGPFKTLIQNPKFQPRRHLQNPIPESENLVTPALKTLTQNPKIQPRRPQPNHNPESENPA